MTLQIDRFLFTNTGGRSANEDSVGAAPWANGGIFVVADGLGGHQDGKKASQYTVDQLLKLQPPKEAESLQEDLGKALGDINEGILQQQKEQRTNMRSTAVALAILEDQAVWAHVGDSRCYMIREGRLMAYTADHSVAYQKFRAGEITREQIGQDEDQSSLLRSLGNPSRYRCDFGGAQIQTGDSFLLCSDGLWEYLHDDEIVVDCLKSQTAREWGQLLLLRAVDRFPEENDNLTLITVKIGEQVQTKEVSEQ